MIENNLPPNLSIAYLPSPGMVKLRLTGRGENRGDVEASILKVVSEIKNTLSDILFGEKADKLEELIGVLLREKGMTLGTAESCTGGYIASKITSIAGSSAYFKGSVVAYDNSVKENVLGVNPQNITDYGAVSEEVVVQMAAGIKQLLKTDYAISTSGIAGPDGGTVEKPVGTVWICVSGPKETVANKFTFGSHRERNIKKAGLMALDILRKMLVK